MDYKISFTPEGKINELPDSNRLYEFILNRLSKEYSTPEVFAHNVRILNVSESMPFNTVMRPLLPMELTQGIDNETYPFLKKLKSIRYISEDILKRTRLKGFFQKALNNLVENKWEVREGILLRRHEDIPYFMDDCLEPVRVYEGNGYKTKIIRLLDAGNSVFQMFVRTDAEDFEKLFQTGMIMDFGLYQRFSIKQVVRIECYKSKQGVLLSKYSPKSIEKEIDIKRSFFRVGQENGTQHLIEGAFLVLKDQNQLINNMDNKGYLYWL